MVLLASYVGDRNRMVVHPTRNIEILINWIAN